MKDGVKNVQLIIDPSPTDDQLDDIIIFDRYNQKPANVTVLGTMSNTPVNPHRTIFKQKFYLKVLDHFFRLFRMVDGYAVREGNDYNRNLLEKVDKGLEY